MIRSTVILAALLAPAALADEVVLKNGQKIQGKVTQEEGRIHIDLENGRITLSPDRVKEIRKDDGTTEVPANGAQAPDRGPDAVREAVRERLRSDPGVGAADVTVDVREGVVVLRGKVDTLLERERAEDVAGTVAGVGEVANEIEVAARPDAELRDELRELLGRDVEVSGGAVTLDEASDVEIVRGVKGVREVRVEREGPPASDAELRREVEQLLRWDSSVDHARIRVEVEGGTARLSGAVPSAAEKARAVRIARRAGARAVEAEALAVEGWRRDPGFREGKHDPAEDEEIERAVSQRLFGSGVLKLDVDVEKGAATLRGEASTLREKREAGREARRVVGVERVENRIRVVPTFAVEDAELADRIRAMLAADPFVHDLGVEVKVAGGAARLEGRVPSFFEKVRADELAARVEGVTRVENALVVDPAAPPLVGGPYVDGWEARDFDWYSPPRQPSPPADETLKEAIERRFFWSPFVNEDEVRVAVRNGEALLTGTVDTLQDREAAERAALEAGASSVTNLLSVR